MKAQHEMPGCLLHQAAWTKMHSRRENCGNQMFAGEIFRHPRNLRQDKSTDLIIYILYLSYLIISSYPSPTKSPHLLATSFIAFRLDIMLGKCRSSAVNTFGHMYTPSSGESIPINSPYNTVNHRLSSSYHHSWHHIFINMVYRFPSTPL